MDLIELLAVLDLYRPGLYTFLSIHPRTKHIYNLIVFSLCNDLIYLSITQVLIYVLR